MKSSDKPTITAERLLELGGSLQGIIQELTAAVGAPEQNPRKRSNLQKKRVAKYLNILDEKASRKGKRN